MISTSEGLFVLGGRNDIDFQSTVYKLKCSLIGDNCYWHTMNLELSIARADFVALTLSDSLAQCEE